MGNVLFNFLRVGVFPECDEDRKIIDILDNDYTDSVERFIDLVLKTIDKESENGEFSLYLAANLCFNSIEAERDEFFAIVTPNNQCVIMLGLFYNRYYY